MFFFYAVFDIFRMFITIKPYNLFSIIGFAILSFGNAWLFLSFILYQWLPPIITLSQVFSNSTNSTLYGNFWQLFNKHTICILIDMYLLFIQIYMILSRYRIDDLSHTNHTTLLSSIEWSSECSFCKFNRKFCSVSTESE